MASPITPTIGHIDSAPAPGASRVTPKPPGILSRHSYFMGTPRTRTSPLPGLTAKRLHPSPSARFLGIDCPLTNRT